MTDNLTQPGTARFNPEVFPSLPVCWATLNDTEVEEENEALDWIAWLVDRYSLDPRIVPPCWDRHGALVEELSALRTAWLASYALTGRPEAPTAGVACSLRHGTAAARRLCLAHGCRPAQHRAAVVVTPDCAVQVRRATHRNDRPGRDARH
jgi:hypothetical protein